MNATLRGAILIDGTGAAARRADVVIRDDLIAEVGDGIAGEGPVIDLAGLALAPGFIDLHSHSDAALIHDGHAEAKVRQGITFELLGQDGLGCAPVSPDQVDTIKSLLAGWVYPEALEEPWSWRTVSEYLHSLERRGISQNVAMLIPHGLVRHRFLGLDDREPSAAELKSMRTAVEHGMQDGAFGMSTGLIYLPCVFAGTEELTELCQPLSRHNGLFDVHIRTYGADLSDSVAEVVEICQRSGARLHLCHYNAFGEANWPKLEDTYRLLDESGIVVSGDQHAYEAASTSLGAAGLPPWATRRGGEHLLDLLHGSDSRHQLRAAMMDSKSSWDNWIQLAGWDGVVVSYAAAPINQDAIGKSLSQVALARGLAPADVALELIEADASFTGSPFSITVVAFVSNDEVSARIMRDDRWGFGTDALLVKGTPHPRCYGTFPRILRKFVREMNVISLERAIWKMTGRASETLGLDNRGIIAPGNKADLVAFDPQSVRDNSTYQEPRSYPDGIPYVFVNGTPVIEDGRHTGATPGVAVLNAR